MRKNNRYIEFRDVVKADLPLLSHWIASSHWQEWWGDVDTEIGYINDMLEGRDTTRPYIFQVNGRDCGYIQMWVVADQLFEPWLSMAPWMTRLPAQAIGVDMSIGDIAELSQGLGSTVLSAFVKRMRAEGHCDIYIDPDPSNVRAIRAYEKAGFRVVPSMLGKTGTYLIMRHEEN